MSVRNIIQHKPLLLILLTALAIRLVLAVAVQHRLEHVWQRDFVIAGDAEGYWELGVRLADGEEYSLYSPPRFVMRMPGFPVFLAGCVRLADGIGLSHERFLVVRLLLAVVGTGACWLVYRLGWALADRTTGLIAAALTAVSPILVGFSVLILSETLFAACLVASLLAMHRVVTFSVQTPLRPTSCAHNVGRCLLAGSLIAVACYVRPSWLLAAPLFAGALILSSPRQGTRWLYGGFVLIGVAATLAPWTYRNYRVTGHPIPTTLWVGASLYDGLNPTANGDSDMTFFEDDNLMTQLSEYEVDHHYRRKAAEFVRQHPLRTLELAGLKLQRYFNIWPNAAQFQDWRLRTAVSVFTVPFLLLAIRGCWLCRKQPWTWLLTLGPILYFAAVHAVFVGSIRYRLPTEYPLAVLSAIGLRGFLDRQEGTE